MGKLLRRTTLCFHDGDVDGNGLLERKDSECAFKIFLGPLPPECDNPQSSCEVPASDVDCDRVTTPVDALQILNRIGTPPQQCFAKPCRSKGAGIRIGILDTGVEYTHPDLGGCFGGGCKVAEGYDFINADADPMDDHGHGTHVASIAAGNGVLLGVAPEATVVAYKVLDANGSGTLSTVIAGIERSIDPDQDGNFADHLDVINLSLGALHGNPDDPLSQAVDAAVERV